MRFYTPSGRFLQNDRFGLAPSRSAELHPKSGLLFRKTTLQCLKRECPGFSPWTPWIRTATIILGGPGSNRYRVTTLPSQNWQCQKRQWFGHIYPHTICLYPLPICCLNKRLQKCIIRANDLGLLDYTNVAFVAIGR